jgi:hypothetical protein
VPVNAEALYWKSARVPSVRYTETTSTTVVSRRQGLLNRSLFFSTFRNTSSVPVRTDGTNKVWHTVDETKLVPNVIFRMKTMPKVKFTSGIHITARLPLRSSGQSFWLQIQRSWVRFPALPDFLRSSGSGTGSTQPREDN